MTHDNGSQFPPACTARDRGDGWDEIVQASFLAGASADRVWRSMITPVGINTEMWPVFKMTVPPGLRGRRQRDSVGPVRLPRRRRPESSGSGSPAVASLEEAPLGTGLGRSWILLGGILPIDFDDVTLVERTPGRRFLERSSTSTTRTWQHERVVEPGEGGVVVVDRLTYQVRAHLRPMRGLYRRMMIALFRHRHARLARVFGSQ